MQRIEIWISRISIGFGALVLLAMMLQVVVDVFMRSFLGAGFPATADLVGRYYMVAISFAPLAMTEISRRHIEATVFTDALGEGARKGVVFLGFLIGLAVFGLMAWGSTQEALRQTARGAYVEVGTLVFPTWPSYWILPASFLLMAAVLLMRTVELVTGQFQAGAHDPLNEVDAHAGEMP